MYGGARRRTSKEGARCDAQLLCYLRSKKAKAPADHSEDSAGTSCYFDTPPTKGVLRPQGYEGGMLKVDQAFKVLNLLVPMATEQQARLNAPRKPPQSYQVALLTHRFI